QLDLLAGDRVAMLLDVELDGIVHLRRGVGELARERHDQADLDGALSIGDRRGGEQRGGAEHGSERLAHRKTLPGIANHLAFAATVKAAIRKVNLAALRLWDGSCVGQSVSGGGQACLAAFMAGTKPAMTVEVR